MSQINVNPPSDSGDRTAAAGINMVTTLITLAVLAVLAFLAWQFVLRPMLYGAIDVNVNVTAPAPAPQNPADTNPNVPSNEPPPAPQMRLWAPEDDYTWSG